MSTKIDATERMLNLVIALLSTKQGRSKAYLRKNINGYTGEAPTAAEEAKVLGAFERMFERDKKTLLELGIPILASEVQGYDAQTQVLYRINPADYQVPAVRLDEDAMTLLAIAANLWAGAALGEAAQSALRKISTRAGTGWYEDDLTTDSRIRTANPSFEPLWNALREHQAVTFSYRGSGSSDSTLRTVHPWGLGSKYGQWYLHAFDLDKRAERNFRLSRITSEVTVRGTETFQRPAHFSIAPVLADLGTGTPHTAHIRVPAASGHSLRQRAGTVTAEDTPWEEAGWDVLRISYREPELMADDVAALGTQAMVMDPPELRDAVVRRLHSARDAALATPTHAPQDQWKRKLAPASPKKRDSRDRLIRLLSMVPYLVANPGVEEKDVLAEFGISATEWAKDMDTLNVTGLPGYYHGDLMDVTSEAGQVFIRDAETLASPLRLTQEEACSALIGLQALTALPGAHRADALAQAIDSVAAVAGDDAWLADAVGLHLITGADLDAVATLQEAISHGRACAMTYLVRNRDELSERIVEPLRLFSVDSVWYLRAWCRKTGGLRSFRVDSIQDISDAGASAHIPAGSAPWQPNAGIYDPGTDDVEVALVADTATALELGPAYNASLFDIGDNAVGLRLLVGDTGTLAPLMARLGGKAHVAGPDTVRSATIDWLVHAADGYDALGETVKDVPSLGR